MKCESNDIKEILPLYLDQALDRSEQERVTIHLETCEDCREELSLIRAMAGEAAPDPGEAFWAEMPGKIYREVQKQKSSADERRRLGLSGLLDWTASPRWAWAAAAVIVAMVTWVIVPFGRHAPDVARTSPPADKYAYEYAEREGVIAFSELNKGELDNVATWANSEMASLSDEIRNAALNGAGKYLIGPERDILYEDLSELNSREAEQLFLMLEKWKPEV